MFAMKIFEIAIVANILESRKCPTAPLLVAKQWNSILRYFVRRNTGTRTRTTSTAEVSLQTGRRCCCRRIFRVKFRYLPPGEKTSGNVLVKLTGLSSCAMFPSVDCEFLFDGAFRCLACEDIRYPYETCLSHFRSKIFSHARMLLCMRVARELCVLRSNQESQSLFSFPLLLLLVIIRSILHN